jgi:hypothetical protein
MANQNHRMDHPTYSGTDSTRGLDVEEYVHEGKAHVRKLVKEKGITPQLAEELKKPFEFNWKEGQIPESEPSRSVKLRLSNTFDPIKATREAFERERAARGKKEKT